MNKLLPKVSILIPVYNAEKYIAATMQSVLNQTYDNIEVIIVNDCGTDGTMDIVKRYVDKRIKIINNDVNRGIAYSRNIGLKNCSGEFVALLDHDDLAIKTRIEKQVLYLQQHPDVAAVGGNAQWIDENDQLVRDIIDVVEDSETIKMFLLFRNIFNNSEMMFRKSVIEENNISYSDNCMGMEDYLFWIKLSKVAKIGNIPDLVLKKRVLSTNETANMRVNHSEARRKKYLELQKTSLSLSGFEIGKQEEYVLAKYFGEESYSCQNYEELHELSAFLKQIILQAKNKNMSVCSALKKWFAELLEKNFEECSNSYLNSWKNEVGITDVQKTKENYIEDLLQSKAFLENRSNEQERCIQEQEKIIRELKDYITEQAKGNDWLALHGKEQEETINKQEEIIQELNEYIAEQAKGNAWLQEHSQGQEVYIQKQEESIKELRAYIDDLIIGKNWLEEKYNDIMKKNSDK